MPRHQREAARAGEKELDALLLPRLGSNDFELVVPTTWYEEQVHPFVERFSSGDKKLSLNRLFKHGLVFADSRAHAGLQLVDVVAYVVRKAILEPDNKEIYAAYTVIRENLRTERDGQALRLVRYDTGQDATDEERYDRCCSQAAREVKVERGGEVMEKHRRPARWRRGSRANGASSTSDPLSTVLVPRVRGDF